MKRSIDLRPTLVCGAAVLLTACSNPVADEAPRPSGADPLRQEASSTGVTIGSGHDLLVEGGETLGSGHRTTTASSGSTGVPADSATATDRSGGGMFGSGH
jgi:hypothetical protein